MVDVSLPKSVIPLAAYDPRSGGQQGHAPQAHIRKLPPKPKQPPKRQSVSDVALIMGIPASDMTPNIQDALTEILNAFDHQRLELDQLRAHVSYMEDQEDRHSFLPVRNRKALFRELSRSLVIAEQTELSHCFLCFHIGNVETIRREQGLAAAEAALIRVAEVLSRDLRASDAIGSLDSTDFGIILALSDGGMI